MTQITNPQETTTRNDLARYLGIAFAGPALAGLLVRATTDSVPQILGTYLVALAMPAPLVAAVVVEKGGWNALVERVRKESRNRAAVLLLPTVGLVTWYALSLGLGALGVGSDGLASSPEAFAAAIAAHLPGSEMAAGDVPPFPALIGVGLIGALVAGVTVNGLFAFGEEYGWRQYLWERFERHGRWGTVGALGVIWGLWHAPLVLLAGINYPEARLAGVFAMIVFTVAASFPLDEIRRASGGAVGPAIFHGMVNGIAGLLVLATNGNALLAPPVGIAGAAAMVGAGFVVRAAAGRWASPAL